MKSIGAGIYIILLTTCNIFIAEAFLRCFENCGSTHYQFDSGTSKEPDCDFAKDWVHCNGSCYGDYQTTSLEKKFPGIPNLKAYVHMGCSPQTFSDSCIYTSSSKYEGVKKRCFCNDDLCLHFDYDNYEVYPNE